MSGDDRWNNLAYLRKLSQWVGDFDTALHEFIGMHSVTGKPLMGMAPTIPALLPINSRRAEINAQHVVVARAAGRAGSATILTDGLIFSQGVGRVDPIAKWDTLLKPKPVLTLDQVVGGVAAILGKLENRIEHLQTTRIAPTSAPALEKKDTVVPANSPNKKSRFRVFIGSSAESIDVVNAVQADLDHYYECEVWHQGVFSPGPTTIERLVELVNEHFDFAIFIAHPDDKTVQRHKEHATVRDNVIFEMGMFMGKLGKDRCFIVYNRNDAPDLPSDLLGVNPATYVPPNHGNWRSALNPACTEIRTAIERKGQFTGAR